MKKIYLYLLGLLIISNYSISQYLEVTSPIGGEDLISDNFHMIEWNYSDLTGDVEISVWDGSSSTFNIIAEGVPITNKKYNWSIPETYSGNKYRIKVASYSSTFTYDMSGSYFSAYPEEQEFPSFIEDHKLSDNENILVYPNPATDLLYISCRDNCIIENIELFDLNGILLRTLNTTKTPIKLKLNELKPGNYFITIRLSDKRIIAKKIVILK
jgi:hypothetical protein